MAGFLAAEQLVEQSVSDSRINQAIDDAQNRQQVNRQPKGMLVMLKYKQHNKKNWSSELPTTPNTNPAVQPKKMARS